MKENNYDFAWVVALAHSAQPNGYRLWTSGAESFGERNPTKEIPSIWQHWIYPPLQDEYLEHIAIDFGLRIGNPELLKTLKEEGADGLRKALRQKMNICFSWPQIHKSFAALLRSTNGCNLFAGKLGILGVDFPKKIITDMQPSSLATFNLFERQAGRPADEIVIGAYQMPVTPVRLFQNIYTGVIVSREQGNPNVLRTWNSLQAMLEEECARFAAIVPASYKQCT